MCCHHCMTTRHTIDIPSLRNTTEIYNHTCIYTNVYLYSQTCIRGWNLYLIPTAKPEPADNWNFPFPPTLGCTTELRIKKKNKLSLQTFSQKRSSQHLKYWDTSNKPAISSSYLSYCNLCVNFFFMNCHEVASKLSNEKHQPLCVTARSN